MPDRPDTAKRPKNPERLIERIRNRSEHRIKHWRDELEQRVGRERKRRRKRIEAIKAQLAASSMSDRGLAMLAGFEGVVLHLYNDAVGACTIGVGHLVHLGNCTAADQQAWGSSITHQRAMQLLHQDVGRFERAVRDLVRVKLDQEQFDALVSFAFNVGEGNLASSTLLRKLNTGDYASVPSELARWTNGGLAGLVTRRRAEGELFAHGRYP